jgi:hypothetical protein
MRRSIKIPIAAMVAGLAIGVLAPAAANANNAQIKVTHAVHKDGKTQTAARSGKSDARARTFRVAVMPAPRSQASATANPMAPKFIRR